MAKKVAKKLSAKTNAKTEVSTKRTESAELKKTRPKRKALLKSNECEEPCYPYGRVGVPIQQIDYIKSEFEKEGVKIQPDRYHRRVTDLFGNNTSLNSADFIRLQHALQGYVPFKIVFKPYDIHTNPPNLEWANFEVPDPTNLMYTVQCDQFWNLPPARDRKPNSLKANSKRSKRKLDLYAGDLEITITWPCCYDDEKPDPNTEQVLTVSEVYIPMYTE